MPVGAIDERGSGPRIWRVVDGKVTPTPVKLLSIDLETARIAANLPALAVSERSLTLFFLLLSIAGGVWAFLSLGRAEDPAFTVRVMVVSAGWLGATTEQMQRQVVDRLEKRIQEVEFHDFTPQQKIPELQYQVRKRMQDEAARRPQGVIGPLVNDDFADVYFTLLALTAPGLPMRDLAREADAMRDRLQRVPGVHKALVLGERSERVFLDFDNSRLANLASRRR